MTPYSLKAHGGFYMYTKRAEDNFIDSMENFEVTVNYPNEPIEVSLVSENTEIK